MFGGGLYAFTLLGIEINNNKVRYLILDPHYVGKDDFKSILKGGVYWKGTELF